MGTQICIVCKEEKPLTEFDAKADSLKIYIDDVCLKCQRTGRKSIEQLITKKHAGGRPEQILPLDLIRDLYNQGYGFKRIARMLGEQGIKTSHTTVRNKLINSTS